MKLNFNSILLSTEDVKKLADFYEKVFEKKPDMEDENYKGFLVGSCFLSIGFHDKIHGKAKDPDRVLFNFETKDVKGEFERIKEIEGVEVVKEPYAMGEDGNFWIATFADPDGNYFQLITPWNAEEEEELKN
ncbi:MAG TPA: VOC family protein [Patescibacteria group bacterium]|nr:VOC family protein [Patescibacteria group bacterium]